MMESQGPPAILTENAGRLGISGEEKRENYRKQSEYHVGATFQGNTIEAARVQPRTPPTLSPHSGTRMGFPAQPLHV